MLKVMVPQGSVFQSGGGGVRALPPWPHRPVAGGNGELRQINFNFNIFINRSTVGFFSNCIYFVQEEVVLPTGGAAKTLCESLP